MCARIRILLRVDFGTAGSGRPARRQVDCPQITTGGTFRFRGRLRYLANAMVDQHIGLEETDDGLWSIYFNTILLATFEERDYIITG